MFFKPIEWLIAFRYIRSKRQEGFISIIAWFSLIGISLGVATLIIVMSVMNGFRIELVDRILGINGHLGIYSSAQNRIVEYNNTVLKVSNINGVLAVVPQIEEQVMIISKKGSNGAIVRGVYWSDLAVRKPLWDSLKKDEIESFKNEKGILIGENMLIKHGLKIGNEISILSPKGQNSALGIIPKRRNFRIVGTFKVGMHEYDTSYIFMPIKIAQEFFVYQNKVSGIEVYFKNPNQTNYLKKIIKSKLGEKFLIYDWRERNKNFLNALNVERNVMFLILTLIIIVAAFNIISSMIMLVNTKNADIAVLRTIGASPWVIKKIFFIIGMTIGSIGTTVGFLLGIIFCWKIDKIKIIIEKFSGAELFSEEIYFLSKLPAKIDLSEVFFVVFLSLFLSFIASIYPAWKASKIAPAEALRYE